VHILAFDGAKEPWVKNSWAIVQGNFSVATIALSLSCGLTR
jgi:hypothetical protein